MVEAADGDATNTEGVEVMDVLIVVNFLTVV